MEPMTDFNLTAHAMRLTVQLRRLLLSDHQVRVDIDAEDHFALLMDATRECRDRKADAMAEAVCNALEETNGQEWVNALRQRLKPGFTPPLHERQVGFRPTRVYRGQRVREETTAPVAPEADEGKDGEGTATEDRPRRELVYRGQRRLV
jgi:hypothetical protein